MREVNPIRKPMQDNLEPASDMDPPPAITHATQGDAKGPGLENLAKFALAQMEAQQCLFDFTAQAQSPEAFNERASQHITTDGGVADSMHAIPLYHPRGISTTSELDGLPVNSKVSASSSHPSFVSNTNHVNQLNKSLTAALASNGDPSPAPTEPGSPQPTTPRDASRNCSPSLNAHNENLANNHAPSHLHANDHLAHVTGQKPMSSWLQSPKKEPRFADCVKEDRLGPAFQADVPRPLPRPPPELAHEILQKVVVPGPPYEEALEVAEREKEAAEGMPRDAIEDDDDDYEQDQGGGATSAGAAAAKQEVRPGLLERSQRVRRMPQWLENSIDPSRKAPRNQTSTANTANTGNTGNRHSDEAEALHRHSDDAEATVSEGSQQENTQPPRPEPLPKRSRSKRTREDANNTSDHDPPGGQSGNSSDNEKAATTKSSGGAKRSRLDVTRLDVLGELAGILEEAEVKEKAPRLVAWKVRPEGRMEVTLAMNGTTYTGLLRPPSKRKLDEESEDNPGLTQRNRTSNDGEQISSVSARSRPMLPVWGATTCVLCHQLEELPVTTDSDERVITGDLGPLIPTNVPGYSSGWVHKQCALWCPEVELVGGQFTGLSAALRRSRRVKCKECNRHGASLVCDAKHCHHPYHLPCARLSGCTTGLDPYRFFCTIHSLNTSTPSSRPVSAAQSNSAGSHDVYQDPPHMDFPPNHPHQRTTPPSTRPSSPYRSPQLPSPRMDGPPGARPAYPYHSSLPPTSDQPPLSLHPQGPAMSAYDDIDDPYPNFPGAYNRGQRLPTQNKPHSAYPDLSKLSAPGPVHPPRNLPAKRPPQMLPGPGGPQRPPSAHGGPPLNPHQPHHTGPPRGPPPMQRQNSIPMMPQHLMNPSLSLQHPPPLPSRPSPPEHRGPGLAHRPSNGGDSELWLGGTTGQPGRAGRCAVCVIQRKGKCGTESAPKKCLRRQWQASSK